MAYTVLARKYRSQDFDQVVGQDHIAKTLKRAIESGRIAHAFLFCGTRGTGKTSMARILAKALNCKSKDGPTTQPCGKCESCVAIARGDDMDVIEIDAASNTGVDNVRDIIENSRYRPAKSRFKIYIIDEVHMLSKQAFNALLKTLEEPPEHVKFILATTEAEKVLQTILSRCQRYDFRNIPTREIAGHLKDICKSEGIKADEDALLLVAKAGAGSMRDSLSLLDRLLSIGEKTLTVDMIEQLLGLPKAQLMFDLAQAIGEGNVKGALQQSSEMIVRGLSADALVAALTDHLRNLLIISTCGAESELVEVPGIALKDLTLQAGRFDAINLTQSITILEELRRHMRQSQAGRALLDATLVRLTLAEQFTPVSELLARVGASASSDSQKKNDSRPVGTGGAMAEAKVGADRAQAFNVAAPIEARSVSINAAEVSRTEGVMPPVGASSGLASVVSAPVSSAPVVSAPPALDFDDDDDDLPRPGKVWEDSGPSLKELLAQQRQQAEPAPSSEPMTNIEPVDTRDVTQAWSSLLESLKDQHGVFGVLSKATFVGIKDEQAVIRLSKSVETFVRMYEKNGKKEMIRKNLSEALGQNIGVRFEVEEGEEAAPAAATAGAPGRTVAAPARNAERPAPVEAPPAPAGPPAIRITPELLEQMRKDPLINSLMDICNATAVKIE